MQRKKLNRNNSNKKVVIVGLIVVLTFGLMASGYAIIKNSDAEKQNNSTASKEGGISYDPPTEEEQQQVDQHKENLPKENEQPNPPQGETVTPVITGAGFYDNQLEVSSFIPGVYEDGGTCTLILASNGLTVSREAVAIKDATVTRCPVFTIPGNEFAATGTWSATVSYRSQAHQGTSSITEVEVK